MEAKRRQAIPILRLLGSDHYRPHRQRRLAEAPAHASRELLFLFNLACEECILPRYYLHVMFPLSSNPVDVSDITHVSLSPSFIFFDYLGPILRPAPPFDEDRPFEIRERRLGKGCCVFVLIMSVKCVCVIVLAQRNAARGAASVVAEAAIRARVLMRTSSTFMSVSFTFSC
jgi:hypothetical protein